MAILTHDCPSCGGNSMGFTYLYDYLIEENNYEVCAFFACPKCHKPVTVFYDNYSGKVVSSFNGDIQDLSGIHIKSIEPPPPTPQVPSHSPASVANCYIEAFDNLNRQNWTSAASMFRRCLEIALKEFAPDIEAWMLEKRINKLAEQHLITPAIKEWAHNLRLDGNKALHGTDPATEDMAKQMERLTYFLLIYLYTLPEQVEAAREKESD